MSAECSVCCESFTSNGAAVYSTPCGHVFHARCIMEWFQTSSNCPQCRCPSTNNDLLRLYFNISSNASRLDFDTTANGIELLEKERMIIVLSQEAGRAKGEAKVLLNRIALLEKQLQSMRDERDRLVADVRSVNQKMVENERKCAEKIRTESAAKNKIITGYQRNEAQLKRDIEKIRRDNKAEMEKMSADFKAEKSMLLKQLKEEKEKANVTKLKRTFRTSTSSTRLTRAASSGANRGDIENDVIFVSETAPIVHKPISAYRTTRAGAATAASAETNFNTIFGRAMTSTRSISNKPLIAARKPLGESTNRKK